MLDPNLEIGSIHVLQSADYKYVNQIRFYERGYQAEAGSNSEEGLIGKIVGSELEGDW